MHNQADIILIHPNDQDIVYGDAVKYTACEPPFWMALAASYIRNKGYEVLLIDAEAEKLSFDEIARKVSELSPVLVGIFVTGTNLSASTQKMHGADLTCHYIKQCECDIPVFFWGLHPSALPERTLKESDADYVIKGENFDTIVSLVKSYQNHSGLNKDDMPGLYYRENEFIHNFGWGVYLDTSELPMPAWELLPMKEYMPHNWHIMGEDNPESAKGRYGVISASIGCPFNCSFCAISSQFQTKKIRFWDVHRVVEEIEHLVKDFNVKYIKILDECFVLNFNYVKDFCDLMIERNLDVNMWCYARVNTITPEILKKLYAAGIRWIGYGIESADYETLKDVDKGQYTVDETLRAMKWTRDAGIHIGANFMFGLPNDNMDTMMKTYELARAINPEWINFATRMLYPGSRDYYDALNRGEIVDDKWIEYALYSYECKPAGSKYLSPKEVLEFRDWAFNAFFTDNDEYYEMIRSNFGQQYVDKLKEMPKNKLRRKLLGD